MIVGRSMTDAFASPRRRPSADRAVARRRWSRAASARFVLQVAAGETLGPRRTARRRAITPSGAPIFGATPLAAGRSPLDGADRSRRATPRRRWRAASASSRAAGRRRASPPISRCAKTSTSTRRRSGGGVSRAHIRARASARTPTRRSRRFSIKTAGVGRAHRDALRRQPAEGRARALDGDATRRLLILEEPTIGVDVGAKAEIYHLLSYSLRKGHGGPADFVRFRGSRTHLQPRFGVQPRSRRGANSSAIN